MADGPLTSSSWRRRQAGIVAGALVASAFEAAHSLAWEDRVNGWAVGFMALAVLVELELLAVTFDLSSSRRLGAAWAFVLSSAVAIGAGVAEAFAGTAIQVTLGIPIYGAMHAVKPAIVAQLGAFDGLLGLGLFAMTVVVPSAVRDAQARALEAERLRTAAELARLRANLQPHFLLNTLSTVAGLAGEDPEGARNLVGALGDLLRDSLEDTGETQTLEDEVKWLKRYAEILETRHRGSITFRWEIADDTRSVRVPRLLLQPLLENAVKHGALRRREGGEVAVRATRSDGRVTCVVEDNGPGPAARERRNGGLGLQLVTRRLALEYAGGAAFRLEVEGGRTRSIVDLPGERAS
jgi:LytS/YehU family sensor histidine kinase